MKKKEKRVISFHRKLNRKISIVSKYATFLFGFIMIIARYGVLRSRVGYGSGESYQRKQPEGRMDCIHLPRDTKGKREAKFMHRRLG